MEDVISFNTTYYPDVTSAAVSVFSQMLYDI